MDGRPVFAARPEGLSPWFHPLKSAVKTNRSEREAYPCRYHLNQDVCFPWSRLGSLLDPEHLWRAGIDMTAALITHFTPPLLC